MKQISDVLRGLVNVRTVSQALEQQRKRLKIVRINLKSTFPYIMRLTSERFLQIHSNNFKNKSLASKYSECFPNISSFHYLPTLHLSTRHCNRLFKLRRVKKRAAKNYLA